MTQTENVESYAVFGDRRGDLKEGNGLALGDNSITLDRYSEKELRGDRIDTITRSFTLVETLSEAFASLVCYQFCFTRDRQLPHF